MARRIIEKGDKWFDLINDFIKTVLIKKNSVWGRLEFDIYYDETVIEIETDKVVEELDMEEFKIFLIKKRFEQNINEK